LEEKGHLVSRVDVINEMEKKEEDRIVDALLEEISTAQTIGCF